MLTPGLQGVARLVVGSAHTAATLGSGDVPALGTPALVALMEAAAVAALAGRLDAAETSVGTRIEIAHLAATPVGDEVRAEARLVAVDGRRLSFALAAFDSRQRVGEGRHERVILSRARFLAKLGQ